MLSEKANAILLDIHLPLVANETSCIYQIVFEANQQLNQYSVSYHTDEKINFANNNDDDDDSDDGESDINNQPMDRNGSKQQIPHVTLFLTDFDLEESEEDQNSMNQTLLDNFLDTIRSSFCHEISDGLHYNIQIEKPIVNSQYAMYQTIRYQEIQNLSNVIVNNTQSFVTQNQSIPDWIHNIQDEEKKYKKIHYIEKYGSPNVYDEFDPHVTCGYDSSSTEDKKEIVHNRFSILNNINNLTPKCGGWIKEVRIGKVGNYGTVVGEPIAVFNMKDCKTVDKFIEQNEFISDKL